jgi:hypothetical protein
MELTRKTQAYLISELTELGQSGWELVSVTKHKEARAGSGEAWFWTAFLKRPHAGQAPAVPEQERAAAPAPAPMNQPARLTPSEDAGEEIEFAETPAAEE